MVNSINSSSSWGAADFNTSSVSQQHKEMFKRLDENSDGKIDESELQAHAPKDGKEKDVKSLLKKIDTDGDGTISESENDIFLAAMDSQMKSKMPPPKSAVKNITALFDKLDTNKDGKISLQERGAAQGKDENGDPLIALLKKADTNNDNSIDADEKEALLKKMEEQMNAMIQNSQTYSAAGKGTIHCIGDSLDIEI